MTIYTYCVLWNLRCCYVVITFLGFQVLKTACLEIKNYHVQGYIHLSPDHAQAEPDECDKHYTEDMFPNIAYDKTSNDTESLRSGLVECILQPVKVR